MIFLQVLAGWYLVSLKLSLLAEYAPFPLSSQGTCSRSLTTLEVTQLTPCHSQHWEFKTSRTWSNDYCIKGVNHFPWSTSYAFVNTAQDTVGPLCCQDTPLVHVQLLSTKTLPAGLLPLPATAQPVLLLPKVLPFQVQDLALDFEFQWIWISLGSYCLLPAASEWQSWPTTSSQVLPVGHNPQMW